jgi:hypothetical protein
MNGDLGALRLELAEARESLALILERKAQYVLRTDVPLQLTKEERPLDAAAPERAAEDLARLNEEVALLVEACRVRQHPGQLEAVEQRAALIARHLLAVYRLSPGEAPELDRLVDQVPGVAG